MAKKNNNRNIRISDQMAELIDQQVGSNFTEKWENLVTRCVWELPAKEAELQRIQERIDQERKRMNNIIRYREELEHKTNSLNRDLQVFMNMVSRGITLLEKLIDDTDCNTD